MIELSDKQAADYFRRCYTAVDGLWFMKIEEKYGFDTALDVDNEVWKIFPKVQARALKSMLDQENGLEALFKTLSIKLDLEDFDFDAAYDETSFTITIHDCPWQNLLRKSGREGLSGKIGSLICNTENSVWANEFGEDIKFERNDQICKGSKTCVLKFSAP
jgi:hypothetical protein